MPFRLFGKNIINIENTIAIVFGENIKVQLPVCLKQKWEGLRYMNDQPVLTHIELYGSPGG